MAKEIVVWCEVHLRDKEDRVPGSEFEITVNGKTRAIDLCPECHAERVAPVEALLDSYGEDMSPVRTKVAKKASAKAPSRTWVPDEDGVFRCKAETGPGTVCGREFKSPQAIGRHSVSHD